MAIDLEAVAEEYRALKAEAEKQERGAWYYPKFKPQEGSNVIRILPPFPDREKRVSWITRMVSYSVGPNKRMIVPPSQFDENREDPLRDHIQQLQLSGDEASKKRASKIRPKKRVFMWVIVRSVNGSPTDENGENHEAKGPQLWSTSPTVLTKIQTMLMNPDIGDITDPENGFDLLLTYTPGEKSANGFAKSDLQLLPKQKPLGDPEWYAEDLFIKYKIGEPSEVDYIRAVLEGKEEAYNEQRKQARQAEKDSEPAPPAPTMGNEPTVPSPPTQDNAAAERALEEIRKQNVAKGRALGLKNRVMIPEDNPDVRPPDTAPTPPGQTYWAGIDGESKKITSAEVQTYVNKGLGDKLMLMSEDQKSGWKSATDFGFTKDDSPPPPSNSVVSELEDALR